MSANDRLLDEAAMKVITDRLVDPWHRTFARDVVEMYLKHSNKDSDPTPQEAILRGVREACEWAKAGKIPTQNSSNKKGCVCDSQTIPPGFGIKCSECGKIF